MIPKDRKLYFALLAPTLLVLLVFIAAPITQSIIFSFHRIIIGLPQLQSPFIGFGNYQVSINGYYSTIHKSILSQIVVPITNSNTILLIFYP